MADWVRMTHSFDICGSSIFVPLPLLCKSLFDLIIVYTMRVNRPFSEVPDILFTIKSCILPKGIG